MFLGQELEIMIEDGLCYLFFFKNVFGNKNAPQKKGKTRKGVHELNKVFHFQQDPQIKIIPPNNANAQRPVYPPYPSNPNGRQQQMPRAPPNMRAVPPPRQFDRRAALQPKRANYPPLPETLQSPLGWLLGMQSDILRRKQSRGLLTFFYSK